jgi:hypothetical protein
MNPTDPKTDKEIELLKAKVELLEKEVEKNSGTSTKLTDEEEYKKSKVLYSWAAPMRAFVRRDRKWFLSIAVIALILVFFLVIVDKPLLIAVILATVFLVYVLATTKPDILEHEITNKGIYTLKKLYKWSEIKSYWFVKVKDVEMLYIETKIRFFPRLILLVGDSSIEELNNLLQKHIPYNYIEEQSRLSKFFDGIYIPAEKLPGKKPVTNRIEK